MNRVKLAVLISGDGSNLQALIDACDDADYPAQIAVVISNKADARGLKRAQDAGIATHIINHREHDGREGFDRALVDTLQSHHVDLICLAGFMRILTPVFIDAFQGRILNTHPSLLPRHGGEGMYGMHVHAAVIAAGDTVSGCTIHHVITDVDRGAVILQKQVDVHADDNAETLAKRVLAQEHIAYPEAVRIMAQNLLYSDDA
ncbi:MAG: phosphoribosylglycinamide formyltransferase [Alphaproteobacteria bacterium]|nr:phosphoribosylglycinamide formyltransferase [Alphaproteobacteria bacterium]